MSYRYIYTEFWKDLYIRNLPNDYKLVYTYLLTNPDTHQCGIYTLDMDMLTVNLKFDSNDVLNILNKFQNDDKIKFNKKTYEIAIKNWDVWNHSDSPKVISHIAKGFEFIKDKSLINYCYSDVHLYNMDLILIDSYEKLMESYEKNKKTKKKPKPFICIFYEYFLSQDFFLDVLRDNFEYKNYIPREVLDTLSIEY